MLTKERERYSRFVEVNELEVFEWFTGSIAWPILVHVLAGYEVIFELFIEGQHTDLIVNWIE